MDCSPPGSSVYGILQARALEWVAIPFSRGSSQPRDRTSLSYVSCIGSRWEASVCVCVPMDIDSSDMNSDGSRGLDDTEEPSPPEDKMFFLDPSDLDVERDEEAVKTIR